MLMPRDIADEVRAVLRSAHVGKGTERRFLTAYQILERLPAPLRDEVIADRGLPGKGGGSNYSAASLIADAAESLHGVETAFLDCGGITFSVGKHEVVPGYPLCGLYRIP